MSEWRSMGVKVNYGPTPPEVGSVIAYDYRAWQVMHVSDAEPTAEESNDIRTNRTPYRVTLRRTHGAPHERENSRQEIGLRVSPFHSFGTYPDGRVPLCSCHGHPWPCLDSDQQEQAERAAKRAEREMRLLPGCCPACQEPVTSRQRTIIFPGPYINNPLAPSDPQFHLRRKCWQGAARYEEVWVSADPSRPRSLLTLTCAGGSLIVHGDGSAECFGATHSDCPSVYAHHRTLSACYLQSHGCPRGCSRRGHPGTRLSGAPVDPRDLPGRR